MNLLLPTEFPLQPVILIMSPQVQYFDNLLQVSASLSMHFGFFFHLKGDEVASMVAPDLSPKIQTKIHNYVKVRQFLNICANTGEAVDDSLLQVLEKMLPKRKLEFSKMDFLKRRDEFSELINKNEEIKKLSEFDVKAKRKVITTTFVQFVKLRNYYTHGKLILKYDSDEYYIQVIDKSTGIKTTQGIDRKILSSFIETGTELIRLISIIRFNN